jgi:hypothetical protein
MPLKKDDYVKLWSMTRTIDYYVKLLIKDRDMWLVLTLDEIYVI